MEIFMSNISFSATKNKVAGTLESIIHSTQYGTASSELTNFDVRLWPNRQRGYGHAGRGTFTVSSEHVGVKFLDDYGGRSPKTVLSVANRAIHFEKSNKAPRNDLLETLRRLPYVSQREIDDRERRAQALQAESISVRAMQFGWECRDLVFSVEWEKRNYVDACAITFQDDPKEIRIKYFAPTETRIIAIRFSQIAWSATSVAVHGEPTVFFSLHTPPSFETEVTPERMRQIQATLGPRSTVYDKEPRQRHTAFDEDHRSSAYTSHAIRLICRTDGDVLAFRRLANETQLHRPQDFDYRVEHRGLFSDSNLVRLQRWLEVLDYEVAFQIESITRALIVDVHEILSLRDHIDDLTLVKGAEFTSAFLRYFGVQAQMLFWEYEQSQDKETVEHCFHRCARDFKMPPPPLRSGSEGAVFDCLHVVQTPSRMLMGGPYPERSNRVIRAYPSQHFKFLRVGFVDETNLQYRHDRDVDSRSFLKTRVGGALLNGIQVAGRFFRFLAYSQSALKEHAVWFVTGFYDNNDQRVDASSIIRDIGSFDNLQFDPHLMRCPARYGARISQAFTATDSSVCVEAEELFDIPDIEVPKFSPDGREIGKWCFTDGVGTMSQELAREIWKELQARNRRGKRIKSYPRALQVRFMGCKGMLSVDYRLQGRAICIRPSMTKFNAPDSLSIDIAGVFDRARPYYLNRPLIMLLEGLGVPYSTFQKYQDIAVREVQESAESFFGAAKLLESHGLGASYRLTSVLRSLEKLGLDYVEDAFFEQSLEFAVHHVLRELKTKARIPIPGAWTLVGVADIHNYLREGEIFACFKDPNSNRTVYLEGPVLISRSPTIHPGDVQVVQAIGRPPEGSCFATERLLHTVVFSTSGSRPLPSCLGGGDLDGDIYNLLPLTDLPEFRPLQKHKPAMYEPAPKKLLDRPCTMSDVAEFFVDYISSDVLGIIAINWMIIADQSNESILDPDCLKLADLHSDAVDYPKSGQPVSLDRIPRLKFQAKPDWNAPETVVSESKRYYKSTRAIGRLCRRIQLPGPQTLRRVQKQRNSNRLEGQELTIEEVMSDFHLDDDPEDPNPIYTALRVRVRRFIDIWEPKSPETMSQATTLFNRYASELRAICANNTLTYERGTMLSEEEALIGTIAAKSSQPRKRQDSMAKLREQTNLLVSGIREDLMGDEDSPLEDFLMRAWVTWELSVKLGDAFGAKSLSWVTLGAVFEAIKDIEERDEVSVSRFSAR